jgi:hypothetical protein
MGSCCPPPAPTRQRNAVQCPCTPPTPRRDLDGAAQHQQQASRHKDDATGGYGDVALSMSADGCSQRRAVGLTEKTFCLSKACVPVGGRPPTLATAVSHGEQPSPGMSSSRRHREHTCRVVPRVESHRRVEERNRAVLRNQGRLWGHAANQPESALTFQPRVKGGILTDISPLIVESTDQELS